MILTWAPGVSSHADLAASASGDLTLVLDGVLAALQSQDFSADLDRDVLISDLTSLTPFIAGLVVVPAALGGLLGRILWESRTR